MVYIHEQTILSDGLPIYKLLSDWERLPRACSGPRSPNDSLVKRRITLSSSPLARLEGLVNSLTPTSPNYLSIRPVPKTVIKKRKLIKC